MIFWLVLKLEISYRVIISQRILVSFWGFFEDYIFAWWNIWVSIILLWFFFCLKILFKMARPQFNTPLVHCFIKLDPSIHPSWQHPSIHPSMLCGYIFPKCHKTIYFSIDGSILFLLFFWVLKIWRNLAKEKRKKVEFTLEKKFQKFPSFFCWKMAKFH